MSRYPLEDSINTAVLAARGSVDGNGIGSYGFSVDYIHITFLIGLLISYIYFRRTHISVGGSLAVGYLAAALVFPVNVIVTVGISLIAYALIHYVVLKIWLPRPRQIFAIGLFTGVVFGLIWLLIMNFIFKDTDIIIAGISMVGVIVPGMLCNSLNKVGVVKTLLPLAIMVPLVGAVGFVVTWLVSDVLNMTMSATMFAPPARDVTWLFALAAVSVVAAILIQEGFLAHHQWRTGGYVTAGLLIASVTDWRYAFTLILTSIILWLGFDAFSRSVPLFGKDRFIVLVLLSFSVMAILQMILFAITDRPFNGAENLVYCVLPAVIANDLVQYRPRRVMPGIAVASATCGVLSLLIYVVSGQAIGV